MNFLQRRRRLGGTGPTPPGGDFVITDAGDPVVTDDGNNIVLDTAPSGSYIIYNGDYVTQGGDKILAP